MNRTEAIKRLIDRADAIKAMGATSLYVFGSTVRDEARSDSDLDLFIDYDRQSRFNAFDLVGIKQFLEQELGIQVDVTTRDGLHPKLRSDIERMAWIELARRRGDRMIPRSSCPRKRASSNHRNPGQARPRISPSSATTGSSA